MYRSWMMFAALLVMVGCDNATEAPAPAPAEAEGGGFAEPLGGYRVVRRCNGLGPASLDLTPRGLSGNYRLLIRGDGDPASYTAVDHLEFSVSWNDDDSAIETARDGLRLFEWRARLTKESGWLRNLNGDMALPDDAVAAYDADKDRFFFESGCGEEARSPAHAYNATQSRLVLRSLNLAMAEARERLHHEAGLQYIEYRGDYLGRSGADGVTEGHHDRNQHLLDVAALMRTDAVNKVPGLARLVTEHRPEDAAQAQRYQQELPAYLRAAAMAHARWYIDSADIRLDWFQGTYPEGEAAIREGMAALQGAYLRLAEE